MWSTNAFFHFVDFLLVSCHRAKQKLNYDKVQFFPLTDHDFGVKELFLVFSSWKFSGIPSPFQKGFLASQG